MSTLTTPNLLASDARNLDALRIQAGKDPKTAVRETARQFESLFMQEMLKSMRAATPSAGLTDNPATKLGTELLDAQLAMPKNGKSNGLSELIARQLERQMGITPGPIPSARPANASLPAVRTAEEQPKVPQKGALGFVQQHQQAAGEVARKSGIPATFMLAQAALETAGAPRRSWAATARARTTCSASRPARAGRARRST